MCQVQDLKCSKGTENGGSPNCWKVFKSIVRCSVTTYTTRRELASELVLDDPVCNPCSRALWRTSTFPGIDTYNKRFLEWRELEGFGLSLDHGRLYRTGISRVEYKKLQGIFEKEQLDRWEPTDEYDIARKHLMNEPLSQIPLSPGEVMTLRKILSVGGVKNKFSGPNVVPPKPNVLEKLFRQRHP